MTTRLPIAALLLSTAALAQTPPAQQPDTPPDATNTSTITVRSTLVQIPTLVKTKSGQLVFTLQASDFLATDDGVPVKLTLDSDTGSQPLALVILVETGGNAYTQLNDYQHLSPLLDNLLGGVDHKIAVVGFDSTPTLLHGFTPDTGFIENSLNQLDPGDKGDAILDAITFSVNLLRNQPTTYRRAILLLSETIDHGSHTSLVDALHAISDTNTAIYSVGFHSTGADIAEEGSKLSSEEPGPEHGCFTRGTDEDGNPVPPKDAAGRPISRGTQNFDCFSQLLPPLRLAKIAEIAVRNGLKKNTPATVARLTGGEYFKFKDTKTLDRDLLTIANHVPNRYVLSFHPLNPHPGFHTLTLTLKDRPNLTVYARNGYWVDDTN